MPSDKRRFARLHDNTPIVRMNPLLAGPAGMLAGAVALGGAWCWEAVLWTRLGDHVPMELFQSDLLAVAVLGGGMGLVCGLTGLSGSAWLVAFVTTMAGLMGATKLGSVLPIPGAIVIGVGGLMALVVGQGVGRVPVPDVARRLLGSWGGLLLAAAAPIYLHLLAGADGTAALVTVLLGVLLIPAALFVEPLSSLGRGFLLPVSVFAGLGGALLAATLPVGVASWPVSSLEKGPLVVLVTVRGLRADRLGGYARNVAPNLNALAQRSVSYTDASATAPWSVPSLGSVLTGRLPYRHGAGARSRGAPTDHALRVDVPSWPTALQRAGFATVAVVGDPGLQAYGLDRGFDEWRDTPQRGPVSVWLLPAVISGLSLPLRSHADHVVDQAIDFVEQSTTGGRLLFVEFADPGGPFDATSDDLAVVGRTNRSSGMDAHDAALARVDRAVGRLIAALPEGTMLIVAGEHGVRLDEPRGQDHIWGQSLHQELLHVPLMVDIRGAGRREIDMPVSLADVGPTILQATGVAGIGEVDGVMLHAVFGAKETERFVCAEATRYGPDARSARMGRYKLIGGQLFDLGVDPRENDPLSADPAVAVERRALMAELPHDGADTVSPGFTSDLGRVAARLAR